MLRTWHAADIAIFLDGAQTDDPIVTAVIMTPVGELEVMAMVVSDRTTLTLSALHIQRSGDFVRPFGLGNLRRLADAVMEELDCDGIRIEGAARTTGSGPGRRQILRFKRRVFPAG